ncbi:MAG: sigma-70 family RNA polymerase sigma factor [Pirellulales bacterium]
MTTSPGDDLPEPPEARTRWLLRYEAWLKLLARLEIDQRFQGKFSASDAVQQTLLEAWRCWDQFRGDQEPVRLAWLRQILAHQLAHLARHYGATQKRDAGRELSLEHTLAQSAARLEGLLADRGPSPSDVAIRREQQLRLAAVLEQLPADYREVIILRNLEELTHEQIAERLGRSPGAIRMLWLRALAALRSTLDSPSTDNAQVT